MLLVEFLQGLQLLQGAEGVRSGDSVVENFHLVAPPRRMLSGGGVKRRTISFNGQISSYRTRCDPRLWRR